MVVVVVVVHPVVQTRTHMHGIPLVMYNTIACVHRSHIQVSILYMSRSRKAGRPGFPKADLQMLQDGASRSGVQVATESDSVAFLFCIVKHIYIYI